MGFGVLKLSKSKQITKTSIIKGVKQIGFVIGDSKKDENRRRQCRF